MTTSRRDFLRQSGCVFGAGAAALAFERLGLINALAQGGDYKALVCVFLGGGNDSDNMIIPYDNYSQYAAIRNTGAALNIPQASLLRINAPSHGAEFGLHPSLTGLHELWPLNKVAAVVNVGPLVEPTTRQRYRDGSAIRPRNLFSHADQQVQWQTSISHTTSGTGWGGRTADQVAILNPPDVRFPMMVTVAGITLFTLGRTQRPLALAPGAQFRFDGFPTPPESDARYRAMQDLAELGRLGSDGVLVSGAAKTLVSAIDNAEALATLPSLTTVFPNTALGNQLRQVAQLIKLNNTTPSLGLRRQLFFCSIGGFDTHNGQVVAGAPTTGAHANLLAQMGNAMRAFYAATQELSIVNDVTTFTLSDFARTFKPNGGVGSDHGWGAHHFVMGGAVNGGNFYGTYPTLAPDGPDDTDAGAGARGRWIATLAVDQYAATLASWYGVAPGDIPAVFPNIGRFANPNLGFMA